MEVTNKCRLLSENLRNRDVSRVQKQLPSKYHVNNKAWMTTDIFSSFLRSLDASMGAQNRNILLFVDNCAAHPKHTSFLRNVKVIRYPETCTSVLQSLDLGVIKCYKQLYRKRLVQTAVCLIDAGKDTKKKINVLEALHYTLAALQQVTQQTIDNCFQKAGYVQGQSSGDSDVVLTNNDDDFRQDWEKFSSMNKDKFQNYVSVDSHVATCGVETVQELCVSLGASGSVEGAEGGEEEDGEPQVVPSFAETHEVLTKVNLSFMCTARVTVVVKVFEALKNRTLN
jgi:hypothetical protein